MFIRGAIIESRKASFQEKLLLLDIIFNLLRWHIKFELQLYEVSITNRILL